MTAEPLMRAAVLHGPHDLRLEDVPRPRPAPGEVLIKIACCGICGTDLQLVSGGLAVTTPLIPGHEMVGVIAEAGARVGTVQVGDRVVVDDAVRCGACRACRAGRREDCEQVLELGIDKPGGFAEYVVAPQENTVQVPESMPLRAAAYVEPLACAIHAQQRAGLQPGETVLVIGGGAHGLTHGRLASICGASKVLLSEPRAARRERALKLGFDEVLDPTHDDIGLSCRALTGGHGVDLVVEAAGAAAGWKSGFDALRPGGRMLAYGVAAADANSSVPAQALVVRRLAIVGACGAAPGAWSQAIGLIDLGVFDPAGLIDAAWPLSSVVKAFEDLRRDGTRIKAQVVPVAEEELGGDSPAGVAA